MEVTEEALARKLEVMLPLLDERQQRLLLGVEARAWGRGGISVIARVAGVSVPTVRSGLREVGEGVERSDRARRAGGGRKRLTEHDPELIAALERLVDPATRGDPMSVLRWTSKSTRALAGELRGQGHKVGYRTVGKLLRGLGYRLQATRKMLEGTQHPDRDAQFRYLADQAKAYRDAGDPVISVDTKKKELVGDFANGGRDSSPKASPRRSTPMIFPAWPRARPSPTASTTSPTIPAG